MVLKPVVQNETTGCGIACVAILASKSYEEVKTVANRKGIFAEDKRLWSGTEYVRTLLAHFKIDADSEETRFTSWDDLPDLALLAIKYHIENGLPFWHWVVFQRSNGQMMVLDPAAYLEDHNRTDLENMPPEWFIRIQR